MLPVGATEGSLISSGGWPGDGWSVFVVETAGEYVFADAIGWGVARDGPSYQSAIAFDEEGNVIERCMFITAPGSVAASIEVDKWGRAHEERILLRYDADRGFACRIDVNSHGSAEIVRKVTFVLWSAGSQERWGWRIFGSSEAATTASTVGNGTFLATSDDFRSTVRADAWAYPVGGHAVVNGRLVYEAAGPLIAAFDSFPLPGAAPRVQLLSASSPAGPTTCPCLLNFMEEGTPFDYQFYAHSVGAEALVLGEIYLSGARASLPIDITLTD